MRLNSLHVTRYRLVIRVNAHNIIKFVNNVARNVFSDPLDATSTSQPHPHVKNHAFVGTQLPIFRTWQA